MHPYRIFACALAACTALTLAACNGGDAPDALVGGNVTGLAAGASVTLTENNATILSVSANGGFELPVPVPADQPYAVAVQTQPAGQMCSVLNASGAVDDNADPVNNVTVSCANVASVGGTVAGLASNTTLTLSDGQSTLPVSANGNFSFSDGFAQGAPYAVTVSGQPAGQTCALTNGTGAIDAAGDAVTNLGVNCTLNGSVSGTVSGLASGATVVLTDGLNSQAVTANGSFVLPDTFAAGASYSVSVVSQPVGQTCNVTNGSGVIDAGDDAVTGLLVSCS